MKRIPWLDPEQEDQAKRASAEIDRVHVIAALELLKNKDIGCEIHISGLMVGICNNSKVVPALNYHLREIDKFLRGQKNEWE